MSTMSIVESIANDSLILPLGLAILSIHIILFLLFKYVLPDGPWRALPSFTAHQVIAFVLMIYQTYVGFVNYKHHGMLIVNEGGLFMARLAIGSMLLWDIPVGIMSDGMGDPIMHLHHIGFFVVATIALGVFSHGVPVGSAYAPFFFGVIELSSIPLVIVDVFHPKQKPWNAYLATSKTLQTINEISRILFAVLYVAARVVYFPYVIVAGVLPDCLSSAKDHPELRAPLYTIMVLAVLFTLLQLYWGTLVIKQIVKALSGGSDGDKKTKKA